MNVNDLKKKSNRRVDTGYFSNSGKLSFVPYTKDFGRITRF